MKKRTAYTIITALSILLICAIAVAKTAMDRADKQENLVAANYRHAFAELVTGVSDMDTALKKSLLTSSPSLASTVCSEIFAEAQAAETALGVLPFSSTELEKTAGFINRVGDYALSLSTKAGRGESFSQEELDGLRALSDTASVLSQNLQGLNEELGSSNVGIEEYASTMEEFDKREGEFIPSTLADGMSVSEQEFPEIPALIYDGPFSNHLVDAAPKLLEGMEEIDQDEGCRRAAEFLKAKPSSVYLTGEINGKLPSYSYAINSKAGQINIWVTKQGGVVYGLINSAYVPTADISAEEAMKEAKRCLERWGYTNMKESYYMIEDNVMVANFAYEQDGVVCYPDLIKVGISMEDGSVRSFEAMGYVSSHTQRELPAAAVSAADARAAVPEGLTVENESLTLIPTAGKNEILCYEFSCAQADGSHALIYVNAETGRQERILLLLEDENGTLTI